MITRLCATAMMALLLVLLPSWTLTGYRQRETIEPSTVCVIGEPPHPPSAKSLSDCRPGGENDIRSRAVDDRFQFALLLGGNRELIYRLLKIVQERIPFLGGNLQVGMR